MVSDLSTRFSEEEIEQCQSWLLPDVSSDNILPSAEKELLDSESQQEIQADQQTQSTGSDIDTGEDIDISEEQLTPLTAEQLQAITDEAEKEGYDQGYQKGLEKGEKAGYEDAYTNKKQEMTQQCEQLEHLIEALLIPLKSEQQQLEVMILDMVCRLTRAIVQREMHIDSSHITQLIEQALRLLPEGTEKFTLFINTEDSEHLKEYLNHYDKECLFQIDDTLMPGGCRLETSTTRIDQSVERRMETLLTTFLEKHLSGDESSDNNTADDDQATEKNIESNKSEDE